LGGICDQRFNFILLIPISVLADCRIKHKNKAFFAECKDKKGYKNGNEYLDEIELKYKESEKENSIKPPIKLKVVQLDTRAIISLLEQKGVKGPADPRVSNVHFASQDIAFFKDP
jgi:hypothetical protein